LSLIFSFIYVNCKFSRGCRGFRKVKSSLRASVPPGKVGRRENSPRAKHKTTVPPMSLWRANSDWQPRLDNPDLFGWSVVAAYVIAAAFCARAALARRKTGPEEERASAVWRLLALGLLFLGINKQLNLQTLLIVLGRRAALAGGWYEERRLAQAVFSAVLTVAGLLALWFMRARFREFFARNPRAFTGLVVLLIFLLIRAASINHVFERAGIKPDVKHDDKRWTWLLEIAGSACLALAAMKAGQQRDSCKQR
jgi:protein-S-isoprenylcysteine O-methyltransferase Ste14